MKIWIDISNSPHIVLFDHIIRDLEKDHELLLTCRPLANTIDLLELSGFTYYIIGGHYGQNTIKKIFGFIIRICQLYKFLRNKGMEVAISHSSFYSPVVSWLLGVRCIYLNDNEHAEGNKISFLFTNVIMLPDCLDIEKMKKQWAKEEKIIIYPGVKEGIYLWAFEPTVSSNFGKRESKKKIYIRPEPWTAQYYRGKRNFIDELLIGIKDKCKVIVLPRGEVQKKHYRSNKFSGITVIDKSISLAEIMSNCDLFIGAGGTMTREAAVLGIPTISIYQDELLDVDNYLINKGFMVHKKDIDTEFVIKFLETREKKNPDKELLRKGKKAYNLIKSTILGNNL